MKHIAIVTGGTKGLGKEISIILANNNYKVYAASRNPERFNKDVITIKLDVSKESECKRLIERVAKTEKRLDLLVNNAGIVLADNKLGENERSLTNAFSINVFGPYYLIKHAYPHLKKTNGKVINITSLSGLIPLPHASVYSASKHALEALGLSLAYEFEMDGLFLINIAPGAIYNPDLTKPSHKTLREKFPILKTIFPMVTQGLVAEKVLEVSKLDNPPKRVILGVDAKMSYLVSRLAPKLWMKIISFLYKK